MRVYDI